MRGSTNNRDKEAASNTHIITILPEIGLYSSKITQKLQIGNLTGTTQPDICPKIQRQQVPRLFHSKGQESEKSSSSCISSERANVKSTSSPRPSIFRNFEKHLVTTLKSQIMIPRDKSSDPTVHLALRMWTIFYQASYYSKRILYFLFGVSTLTKTDKNQVYEKFASISDIYPIGEIEMAQEFLREEVIRQGSKLLSTGFLSNRRIEKAEQFLAYFQAFLSQLKQGAIIRRVLKCSIKAESKMQPQQ